MMTILLENIELFGYHGVSPLEQKTGTHFILHVTIEASLPPKKIKLEETIDYAAVHALIREEFTITEELLENLSLRIIQKIFTTFIQAEIVSITILKKDAPISGFRGQVGVKNCFNRSEIINKVII